MSSPTRIGLHLIFHKTIAIILSDAVNAYLEPSIRQLSYAAVNPRKLSIVLTKLSRASQSNAGPAAMGKAERRRLEAESVGRLAA